LYENPYLTKKLADYVNEWRRLPHNFEIGRQQKNVSFPRMFGRRLLILSYTTERIQIGYISNCSS